MVLKHKPDLLISKRGELFRVEQEWVLSFECDGAARRWFERTEHVEQRALAAARRAHDRDCRARRQRQRDVRNDSEWTGGRKVLLRQVLNLQQTRPPFIAKRKLRL